jgi:adenosylcobinamide-phosphate synthase
MAGVLGVRLGGTNFYDGIPHNRPTLGLEGRSVKPDDIVLAAKVMVMASVLAVLLAIGVRWLL